MLSNTTKASLEATHEAWCAASRTYAGIREKQWTRERVFAAQRLEKMTKALRERVVQCAGEFARSRGWKWHPMSLRTAGDIKRAGFPMDFPEIDHADAFFRDGHVVALVTHSYRPLAELQEYAAKRRLTVEPLEWSWHNPDGCTAALFTSPAALV